MPLTAVKPSQIRKIAANSLVGNNTGAEARGTSLSVSQVRTLLGLGTADSPSFSGMTLSGNLLFNATNTYDVGNGTYDPRTVRAATSVLTPLLKSASGTLGINSDDVNNVTIGSSANGHTLVTGGVPEHRMSISGTPRYMASIYGVYLHTNNAIWFSGTLNNATSAASAVISRSGAGRVAITTNATWTDGGTYGTLDAAAVDRPTAALTLGNATYGVTVPGFLAVGGTRQAATFEVIGNDSGGVFQRIFNADSDNLQYATFGLGGSTAYGISSWVQSIILESTTSGGISFSAFHTSAPIKFTFGSGRTEKARFSPTNGHLLIGTTTDDGTSKLQVNGATTTTSVVNPTAALTLGNSTYGVLSPGHLTVGTDSGAKNVYIDNRQGATTWGIYYTYFGSQRVVFDANSSTGEVRLGGIGAGGSYYPVLYSNGTACLSFTTGGAATFTGDISMQKATQGYIRAYGTGGVNNIAMYDDNTNGILSTSSGALVLSPAGTSGVRINSPAMTGTPLNIGADAGGNGVAVAYSVSDYVVVQSGGIAKGIVGVGAVPLKIENAGKLLFNSGTSLYHFGVADITRPAIKVTSTTAAFRLGDDSADAPISCAGITASGNVSYAQGLSTGTVTKSANYTTTADDYCVNVTANSIDITFETAVGCANREHEVINSGSGVVTLKTTSAQTISGSASGALTLAQYKAIRVKSDGANWLIMSQIT